MKMIHASAFLVLATAILLGGCETTETSRSNGNPAGQPVLEVIAESSRQWTGIAISEEGSIFVCYPRWSDSVPFSVGELQADGTVRPYPGEEINKWDETLSPEDHFVCVQALYVDSEDFLWILDPANPRFAGVVEGGPKLIKADLSANEIVKTIRFGPEIAPKDSYLNDVRVDPAREYAYITDSGLGAIIVVNLKTGASRRVLGDHPSTKSEGIALTIDGREWRRPDGSIPSVNADGIALNSIGTYLYYQALTGRSLYRIETVWLRDENLPAEKLGETVELVAESGPADGIAFGPDEYIYLSAIEENAIKRLAPNGKIETVVKDKRIQWPDSFAIGPDGGIYFTTSQIHLGPDPREPYLILRLKY